MPLLLIDTIWTRPQEWVCVCVSISLTLVKQTSRLHLLYFLVVSFNSMCLLTCGRSHSFYFGVMYSVICTAHPPAGPLVKKYVCSCVCVGIRGAPWGEAGHLLPVAALGQGMSIQDTCPGSYPNLMVAFLTLYPSLNSPPSFTHLPTVLTKVYWPPFNPSVHASCFVYRPQYLPLSCCLSIFLRLCHSLSLPQYFGKVVFLH